jgi:hypothetical protein
MEPTSMTSTFIAWPSREVKAPAVEIELRLNNVFSSQKTAAISPFSRCESKQKNEW